MYREPKEAGQRTLDSMLGMPKIEEDVKQEGEDVKQEGEDVNRAENL
jgi:hypothetical protein